MEETFRQSNNKLVISQQASDRWVKLKNNEFEKQHDVIINAISNELIFILKIYLQP